MHREHVRWHSPHLGRDMDLLVFGHAGTPVVVFPSSRGRFYEWEDFGMVKALAPQLEGGHNRLVCLDSVDDESLYNDHAHPADRVRRHQQYERYAVHEALPYARHLGGSFVIAAGASFGGYHAANLYFKYPGAFGKMISLSGAFSIRSFLDGHFDEAAYLSSPADFLPGLHDPAALDALRRGHVVLTAGEHDPCREATDRLAWTLRDKGLPHTYDLVPGFGHDWPWWQDQIARHVV